MDKNAVHRALIDHISAELARVKETHKATTQAAFHEENKAEDDKDTRAIEGSYLARGLAERVANLEGDLTRARVMALRPFGEESPVGLSALVAVEDVDSGAEARYFLAPVAGGAKLQVGGELVRVLTPSSPLGGALLGSVVEDEVSFNSPQGLRTLEILSVS